MTTITIDEITRNAILAALDERAERLESEVAYLESEVAVVRVCIHERDGAHPHADCIPMCHPTADDLPRALVWNIAALHETKQAREIVAEAQTADHPADAAWTAA